MENKNKRPGRPRRIVMEDKNDKIPICAYIPKSYWVRASNSGITWGEFMEAGIDVKIPADRTMREEKSIREKLNEVQIEEAKLRIRLDEIEKEKRIQEEMRKTLDIEAKFKVKAFRKFFENVSDRRPSIENIEPIERTWGISFDYGKIQKDYEQFILDFQTLPDTDLLKKYSVEHVAHGGMREREILQTLEKEYGINE